MPANTEPIYSRSPAIGISTAITAASTLYTGLHASDAKIFTADATNGAFVQKIRFKALGTCVATVARIYINTGSTASSTNYALHGELSLAAMTTSATNAMPDYDYAMNIPLPAGYCLYVGLGTAVSAGWICSTIAGSY
jgi:hypothetical protein